MENPPDNCVHFENNNLRPTSKPRVVIIDSLDNGAKRVIYLDGWLRQYDIACKKQRQASETTTTLRGARMQKFYNQQLYFHCAGYNQNSQPVAVITLITTLPSVDKYRLFARLKKRPRGTTRIIADIPQNLVSNLGLINPGVGIRGSA